MSDYKLVNIVDSQLDDIASEITLPVITGAQSTTYNTFNAQASTSNNQIQYNIAVPSMATAMSRHVLTESTIELKIDFEGGTTADYWEKDTTLFDYGDHNALQAFPLNSLLQTLQSTINSTPVSVNSRDMMAGLLKLYNYEELAKYNSLCPSMLDSFYYNYADGAGASNNVLGNYSVGGFDKQYQPRGAFPITVYGLNPDGSRTEIEYSVSTDDKGTAPYASIIIQFTTIEPLLFLSPYMSGHSNNQASMLGLNNLTFTFLLGDASRVMSNATYANRKGKATLSKTISNVSLLSTSANKLLINFMTLPNTLYDKISPKNVLTLNQYANYNYNTGEWLSAAIGSTRVSKSFSFNNLQLNQIPTKILIYARKSQLTSYDSNSFAVIKSVSFNFANKSGILAGANQSQLYDISVKNGLQMNYYEFNGRGVSCSADKKSSYVVPTIGSILVVDPAIDFNLTDQYTNMSTGQFNLQFTIELENQTGVAYIPTLYCVCINSGLFITENGTSQISTGLLTQEAVLETKVKESVMDKHTYENTIVGGSIENINSIHKHLKLNFSRASEKEDHLDNGVGEVAAGMSAAGMSGSAMPKRKIHKYRQ